MKFSDYYASRTRPAEPDDPNCKCILWTGTNKKNDNPIAKIDGQLMSVYAMAWIVDGGMLSDGPFVRTCKTRGCVAVEHIRMKSEDPLFDDQQYDQRLDDGFKMLGSGEEDDLSDQVEGWQ